MINTLLKRRMENTKKNKKGFTLVELIVVLVIIAILAAVLIPTVSGYIKRANKTADQSACKTSYTAFQAAVTDKVGEAGDTTGLNYAAVSASAAEYGAEIDKCKVKIEDGAVTELQYNGSHFLVTYKVGSDGKVTYTYADTDSRFSAGDIS